VAISGQIRLSLVFAAASAAGGCGDDAREGDASGHEDTEGVETTGGPGGTSPSGGAPGTSADTNGDSSDTDSASGTDTQAPGETDTDTGEEDLPDDGYVSLVWTQADDEAAEAFLIGQVYAIVEPGVAAVEFAQPHGVDDCALTLYTLADLQEGSLPTYEHQSAGPLSLTGGGAAHRDRTHGRHPAVSPHPRPGRNRVRRGLPRPSPGRLVPGVLGFDRHAAHASDARAVARVHGRRRADGAVVRRRPQRRAALAAREHERHGRRATCLRQRRP
jgi:hypothetical protein